jgi:hypothetical protein
MEEMEIFETVFLIQHWSLKKILAHLFVMEAWNLT